VSLSVGPAADLFEQLGDGIVITDEQLQIVYANPAIHRISGHRLPTLIGQPVTVLIPADLRAAHLDGVARTQAGSPGPLLAGPGIHTRLQHTDGTVRDIGLMLRALDNPARYAAIIRPLEHSTLHTDAILDAIGEGVYGLDRQGDVMFVNPTAAKLTGFSVPEQLGRNQHELIHHHHADGTPYPVADCPIMATLTDGQRREATDEAFWTATGEPLPVDYTAAPITHRGQVTGVVVSFRDANERRQGERNRILEATAAVQAQVITELHRAIIPDEPAVAGYGIAVTYRPAGPHAPTGGDLYDWARLPDGTYHFCVVDVAGHDVTATKHALSVVHTIRSLVLAGIPLQHVLDQASRQLEATSPELTATAVIIHLHPETGNYQLHAAGHPPPLHLPAHGTPTYHHPQGTPLGAPRQPPTPNQTGHLNPGDALIAYTDGLIEHHGDLATGMTALLQHAGRPHDPGRLIDYLTAHATHPDDTLQLHITRYR
jgi:PAS domain S-box-containing protein